MCEEAQLGNWRSKDYAASTSYTTLFHSPVDVELNAAVTLVQNPAHA